MVYLDQVLLIYFTLQCRGFYELHFGVPVEFFFSETAHNSETAWYIMIKIGIIYKHCIIVKTLVCKTFSDTCICILALFAMYI